MKYRKKPLVIEAVLWKGDNFQEVSDLGGTRDMGVETLEEYSDLIIKTLEGDMRVCIGDWIVKGLKGELYPCKPDIFEATCDKVELEGRQLTGDEQVVAIFDNESVTSFTKDN